MFYSKKYPDFLCLWYIPSEIVLENIKDVGILYFTLIRPLRIATPNHYHLIPKILLGSLNDMLQDPECFEVFYYFSKEVSNSGYISKSMDHLTPYGYSN